MATYSIVPGLLTTPIVGERLPQGSANIDAARMLYLDISGDLAIASNATQLGARVVGISLTTTVEPGQAVHYQTAGIVDAGGASFGAAGKRLVLTTAGKMMDEADLAIGQWVTYLGVTISDHEFDLDIMVTNQQAP